MIWRASTTKQKAVSDLGYTITWAENKHGIWYNAYTREHRHIAAGYNDEGRDRCKAACEAHLQRAAA